MTDATMLTNGSPVPEDRSHTTLKDNGQQRDYVVLTPEERAKGFVKPLRMSYVHTGVAVPPNLRDLTDEERKRWGDSKSRERASTRSLRR